MWDEEGRVEGVWESTVMVCVGEGRMEDGRRDWAWGRGRLGSRRGLVRSLAERSWREVAVRLSLSPDACLEGGTG